MRCSRRCDVVITKLVAVLVIGASVGIATSALTVISGELYSLFAAHAFWVMAALALVALPLTRGLRIPDEPS